MLIVKAIANPNLPLISAALFHSTPFLTMKKRVNWPQRSDSRGPPRLRFKLVFKKPQYSGFIGNSYDHQNETSGNWRAEGEKTQDCFSKHSRTTESSTSSKKPSPGTISNRQALGLNVTGPLTLNQVKIAYRQTAIKWHPDHHQGIDKALAEANFKKINAAHESLCNELSGP